MDSTVEFFSVILLFGKIMKMYKRYEKLIEDSEEFDAETRRLTRVDLTNNLYFDIGLFNCFL